MSLLIFNGDDLEKAMLALLGGADGELDPDIEQDRMNDLRTRVERGMMLPESVIESQDRCTASETRP